MRPRPLLVVSNHAEIVGGGEISLLALLEGLDRSRWAPTVVVPGEGAVAARCHSLEIPVRAVPLPSLRRPGWAVARAVIGLRGLACSSGACLVHANGSRAMLYAGPACRLAGIPAIWHVRIADRDGPLDRFLAGLARAVIVNSRAVGRRFNWAPQGKVRCIHNGVDTDRFAPRRPPQDLRTSLGLPDDVPVVVSVGRFVAFKGYASLLEAAHLVRAAAPDVHWLLVGDGELRGDLEARCGALALDGRVRFTGWREDIPDLLTLCDLFVLPSLGEHFGRVLIEAMAMARPVVATDAGGVPEIVIHDETGLLVPPGDPKGLAEAVLALLADPVRARDLGGAGRRRAESCFSLRRHVQAVEAVYREVGGGAG